jgi:hypothetical protein
MPITEIVEVSNEEAIAQYTDRFFRRVYKETDAIPASYAGKYASAVTIATNAQLDDTTAAQLETAIENIPGVHIAIHMAQGRIPVDRVPADTAETTYTLHLGAEFGFNIRATPVAP